jgi:hypothetical protein
MLNGAATVRERWISGMGRSVTFAALACNLTPASHRMFNPAAPEALLCWGNLHDWGVNGHQVMEKLVLGRPQGAAHRTTILTSFSGTTITLTTALPAMLA